MCGCFVPWFLFALWIFGECNDSVLLVHLMCSQGMSFVFGVWGSLAEVTFGASVSVHWIIGVGVRNKTWSKDDVRGWSVISTGDSRQGEGRLQPVFCFSGRMDTGCLVLGGTEITDSKNRFCYFALQSYILWP